MGFMGRYNPLALLFSALAALGLMEPQSNNPPVSKRERLAQARRDRDQVHMRGMSTSDGGQFDASRIVGVVFTIIGLIVTVAVIDGLDNDYYNQTDNIEQSMSTANFTNPVLDNLASPLGLLVGIVLLLGLVVLILRFI